MAMFGKGLGNPPMQDFKIQVLGLGSKFGKRFGVLTVWRVGWWFRILRFKGVHGGVA